MSGPRAVCHSAVPMPAPTVLGIDDQGRDRTTLLPHGLGVADDEAAALIASEHVDRRAAAVVTDRRATVVVPESQQPGLVDRPMPVDLGRPAHQVDDLLLLLGSRLPVTPNVAGGVSAIATTYRCARAAFMLAVMRDEQYALRGPSLVRCARAAGHRVPHRSAPADDSARHRSRGRSDCVCRGRRPGHLSRHRRCLLRTRLGGRRGLVQRGDARAVHLAAPLLAAGLRGLARRPGQRPRGRGRGLLDPAPRLVRGRADRSRGQRDRPVRGGLVRHDRDLRGARPAGHRSVGRCWPVSSTSAPRAHRERCPRTSASPVRCALRPKMSPPRAGLRCGRRSPRSAPRTGSRRCARCRSPTRTRDRAWRAAAGRARRRSGCRRSSRTPRRR